MISFLKKLWGGESRDTRSVEVPKSAGNGKASGELVEFVEYVAKSLVDEPGRVSVSTVDKGRLEILQISCEKRDIGKIIGKNGKTIAAIRVLVTGAAGRYGKKVTVEVLD